MIFINGINNKSFSIFFSFQFIIIIRTTTTVTTINAVSYTHLDVYKRQPLHYQEQVDAEVRNMLESGVIERTDSNFLNPMVVVKKKNNDIRLCLDMRNLNTITKKCYDCAPNAESLFIKCQGVKYRSRLDLKSGFWQIPLAKESRKYTAFLYQNKCYQLDVYKIQPDKQCRLV